MSTDGATTARSAELPQLRQDLTLERRSPQYHDESGWLIYDPLRHSYIHVDHATFVLLSLWPACRTVAELVAATERRLGHHLESTEIAGLIEFLKVNRLTTSASEQDWRVLAAAARRQRAGLIASAMHRYLFFKIPLWNPQRFLHGTRHLAAPLFHAPAQLAIMLIGAAGLYLVSRQWDEFSAQTSQLLNFEGALAFGLTAIMVKALHELGHAYAADRFACRVPMVGIAFMLMAPLPYADVTDAWRIRDRKQRITVDAAGVAVEFGIACLASFVWVFLPPGLPRDITFLLATTSWMLSLAINLNPFMRFDGYYILSDLFGIDNLQDRSFALGRWALREALFGLGISCPEVRTSRMVPWLIAYAYAVWLYRLLLFTGIALLVYAYFFKALGMALFVFEIIYFIVRPVTAELSEWWTMRHRILRSHRFWTVAMAAGAIILLLLTPWSGRVAVPAVLEARELSHIRSLRSGVIETVRVAQGKHVEKGAILLTLASPALRHETTIVEARLEAVEAHLRRQSADGEDREGRLIYEQQRDALRTRLLGIAAERRELTITAPISGVVAELSTALRPGLVISTNSEIALIRGQDGLAVRGLVPESSLWRLQAGASGRFVPETATLATIDVTLTAAPAYGSRTLELPALASVNGGPILVETESRDQLVPLEAHYPVLMSATSIAERPSYSVRGVAYLQGAPESFAAGLWRRVLKVLVRESGA